MPDLRHIYRNLKLKHIPSKRYNRKYDPKYLDELASKGCSVKLGFGDFDGDYDLDGTYPKQRAGVAEKPGIYTNKPLRGPHSMSAMLLPSEGPLFLGSTIIKPALGPAELSSAVGLPVQGPTALETETVKPFGGPQNLVSTTAVPVQGPASMQAVTEPVNGPLSLNSTIAVPTNSPLSLSSTVIAPAVGPTNVGSAIEVQSGYVIIDAPEYEPAGSLERWLEYSNYDDATMGSQIVSITGFTGEGEFFRETTESQQGIYNQEIYSKWGRIRVCEFQGVGPGTITVTAPLTNPEGKSGPIWSAPDTSGANNTFGKTKTFNIQPGHPDWEGNNIMRGGYGAMVVYSNSVALTPSYYTPF